MRLILSMLAVFNLRWANADLVRAAYLQRERVAVLDRAQARYALASCQTARSRALR